MRRVTILALLLLLATVPGRATADQTDPRLDALFRELETTGSPRAAASAEREIWAIWMETDEATARRALARGIRLMRRARLREAETAFTRAIEAAPEFAEAWNKRATVRFLQGADVASARDIRHTLALEPRHFGALSGLGIDTERRGSVGQDLQPHVCTEAKVRWLRALSPQNAQAADWRTLVLAPLHTAEIHERRVVDDTLRARLDVSPDLSLVTSLVPECRTGDDRTKWFPQPYTAVQKGASGPRRGVEAEVAVRLRGDDRVLNPASPRASGASCVNARHDLGHIRPPASYGSFVE